jgi:hypothetical protein
VHVLLCYVSLCCFRFQEEPNILILGCPLRKIGTCNNTLYKLALSHLNIAKVMVYEITLASYSSLACIG